MDKMEEGRRIFSNVPNGEKSLMGYCGIIAADGGIGLFDQPITRYFESKSLGHASRRYRIYFFNRALFCGHSKERCG